MWNEWCLLVAAGRLATDSQSELSSEAHVTSVTGHARRVICSRWEEISKDGKRVNWRRFYSYATVHLKEIKKNIHILCSVFSFFCTFVFVFLPLCVSWGRSHVAPKNAFKARRFLLLSKALCSLRSRLPLLSNHDPRSSWRRRSFSKG